LGYYEAFRRSKDPPSFMVLFEDTAALLGIVIAAVGTYAATTLGNPMWDGMASIMIGVVLGVTSVLLVRESKSLLIGERADKKLSDSILRIAAEQHCVRRANGVLTVQLAPDQVVAALSLEFDDTLPASELEAGVVAIEARIRGTHPEVTTIFVKPQTGIVYEQSMRAQFGDETEA
jgi:divalent metal cation (Fe/Co/Zn/Cd) transporter